MAVVPRTQPISLSGLIKQTGLFRREEKSKAATMHTGFCYWVICKVSRNMTKKKVTSWQLPNF